MAIFRRGPSNGCVECRGYEKSRFSTDISLYLGNDTNRAKVTKECEQETVQAFFNDLFRRPLTQISRSRHSLTLNISETVRDTDTDRITMEY